MSIQVFIAVLLLLVGCATGRLTPDQIQWRRSIDTENWVNCSSLYHQSGAFTTHYDHRHTLQDIKLNLVKPWYIRDDLIRNSCQWLLRDFWIEYGAYGKPIIRDSNGENMS